MDNKEKIKIREGVKCTDIMHTWKHLQVPVMEFIESGKLVIIITRCKLNKAEKKVRIYKSFNGLYLFVMQCSIIKR